MSKSDNLIHERIAQISQEIPIEKIESSTLISPLDILFGDIGRLVSGKISPTRINLLRSWVNSFREVAYFFTIYFSHYRKKKEKLKY